MPTERRIQRIRELIDCRQQGVVVLEDIRDPWNAAAVFRSCDAFGIQRVLFVYEKELRHRPDQQPAASSSSADRWLDIEVVRGTEAAIDALRKSGHRIVATVAEGEGVVPVHEADLTEPRLSLWFGNEAHGLSEIALAAADLRVTVPMHGMIRSFNLSVSAGVCLYELWRQRARAGLERYRLDGAARAALAARWLGPQQDGARA